MRNIAATDVKPGQMVAATMSDTPREVFVAVPTWDGKVEVSFVDGPVLKVAPTATLKAEQERDEDGRFIDDDA